LLSLRSASFTPSPAGTAMQLKRMLECRRFRGAKKILEDDKRSFTNSLEKEVIK
jgi:hypothetical protein